MKFVRAGIVMGPGKRIHKGLTPLQIEIIKSLSGGKEWLSAKDLDFEIRFVTIRSLEKKGFLTTRGWKKINGFNKPKDVVEFSLTDAGWRLSESI